MEISPLLSEVKALLGDHSLLVSCAQKAVESPHEGVLMCDCRLLSIDLLGHDKNEVTFSKR